MSETLLPANASSVERAMEMAMARIEDVPTPARSMWNPDTCPVEVLAWLAWAFSVDTWDPSWTEAQKRASIKAAYSVQRRKGTIGAVKRALAALGLGVEIVEWFQEAPKADPYTFRVVVRAEAEGATQAALSKMMEVIDNSKNLRSHMTELRVELSTSQTISVGAMSQVASDMEIEFDYPLRFDGSWNLDGSYRLNGLGI